MNSLSSYNDEVFQRLGCLLKGSGRVPAGQCARRDEGATVAHLCLSVASDGREIFWIYYWKKNGPFWTPSQNFWPCFCWNDILFYKQLWAPTPHSCSHRSYCFRVSSSSLVNSLQNVEMLDNCARARMHMCGSRDWGALWWEDFAGVCSSAIQRTRAPRPPSPSMASKADAAKAPHSQCCQHAQQKLIFLVGRDGWMESGCGLSE